MAVLVLVEEAAAVLLGCFRGWVTVSLQSSLQRKVVPWDLGLGLGRHKVPVQAQAQAQAQGQEASVPRQLVVAG